ncbi:unnamed protein product [Ceratitis capitata]|uniref:(Mediterranean fruit fly) hypothetical protein n=1 Tax=Ceratitis capitata TaxID=7213 RepID=A0A811UF74_CERCA|nr:unnamed protein product [Ceratitis capitata]
MNIVDNLESRFIKKSIESIKRSHVVILMLDSIMGIEQQNLSIGENAIKEGKGIIIVLNKWDLINKDDRSKLIKFIEQQKVTRLSLEVSVITISALKGCTEQVVGDNVSIEELRNKLLNPNYSPSCDRPSYILGVSVATWNLIYLIAALFLSRRMYYGGKRNLKVQQ